MCIRSMYKKKKKVSNVQNKIIFHEILEGQKEKLEKLQNKDEILQKHVSGIMDIPRKQESRVYWMMAEYKRRVDCVVKEGYTVVGGRGKSKHESVPYFLSTGQE